jgi:hypothetical protein
MTLVDPYQTGPPASFTTEPSLTESAASKSALQPGSEPRTSGAQRTETTPRGRHRARPGPRFATLALGVVTDAIVPCAGTGEQQSGTWRR